MLSIPDYGVGNFLEQVMEQKKSGVFSGVTTSWHNEQTGFNTHLKIQYKQSCIPLAVWEAAGIQDGHGHSARGSGMPSKSCLCLLCPSASFGRAQSTGEPQTLWREEPVQHHSNISVTVSYRHSVTAFAAGNWLCSFPQHLANKCLYAVEAERTQSCYYYEILWTEVSWDLSHVSLQRESLVHVRRVPACLAGGDIVSKGQHTVFRNIHRSYQKQEWSLF